jgi:hypothetical protein
MFSKTVSFYLYMPVETSHILIVLSQEQVANLRSSGVIAQFDIMLLCDLEKIHIF